MRLPRDNRLRSCPVGNRYRGSDRVPPAPLHFDRSAKRGACPDGRGRCRAGRRPERARHVIGSRGGILPRCAGRSSLPGSSNPSSSTCPCKCADRSRPVAPVAAVRTAARTAAGGHAQGLMKELRFGAAGGEWRVAFAFDPARRAVLLVAGDKCERRFYPRSCARPTRASTGISPGSPGKEDRDGIERRGRDRGARPRREAQGRGPCRRADRRGDDAARARKARALTQASVARELGIGQDAVSRLEQRSDLLLSTLRRTVEAMGGSLSLVARFPDRPPVELSGIAGRDTGD